MYVLLEGRTAEQAAHGAHSVHHGLSGSCEHQELQPIVHSDQEGICRSGFF